jgi:predicted RNase H-like HicB family nuclease
MLVPVAFAVLGQDRLHAAVPDLPGCERTGTTEQTLLPMVRLAIEAEVTRRLLAGEPLPDTRDGEPPAGAARARWLTIHINIDHLRALAIHQRQRP